MVEKERRVLDKFVNEDTFKSWTVFYTYNYDGSIDYFKLSDVKDANKDNWIITDYPVIIKVGHREKILRG